MKIVVLTGSPHEKGTTSVLTENFVRGAKESGHEVFVFDCAQKSVVPCIACETCHQENGYCVMEDDFEELKEKLIESNAVVFVSPIYYYGMTAQIKTVIDRFYAIDNELHSYKRTALMLAFADTAMDSAEGAIKSFQGMTDYLNWEIVDIISALNCPTYDDIMITRFPQMAYELGRRILGDENEGKSKGAKSLEELVANLTNFSDLAADIIKKTEEKEGFLE